MFAAERSAKAQAARRKRWIIGLSAFSILMLAANAGLVRARGRAGPAVVRAACLLRSLKPTLLALCCPRLRRRAPWCC